MPNYCNRCMVLLINHDVGNPKSSFPLRGSPPAKQQTPIVCLGIISNHFVLIYLKDGCPLLPLSTEWQTHKNEEAMSWENEYLDQHDLSRNLMIIEKRAKLPQPKNESNKAELILLDTPKKGKQLFEVIAEDEENSISLYLPQSLGD